MQKKELQDIMYYEPTIWAVADYLIAAGIKQSKFPDYMMPFFALVMLEGRMLNEMKLVEEEMEKAMELKVPLLAEAESGTNWLEVH